ncbi:Repeat domain in Vibrio, Colwellia, Bradyrhizobium and Shewanella [uncultured archaeon]|nr:Repeat domain in Vibrio, Colwellia, Bradyrhizobium and Shewanella [uncultured archaeon]
MHKLLLLAVLCALMLTPYAAAAATKSTDVILTPTWVYALSEANKNINTYQYDGRSLILVDSTRGGTFYALEANGSLAWSRLIGSLMYNSFAANDPDGQATILMGSPVYVHAFNSVGDKKWSFATYADGRGLYAADFNKDGKTESVIGTSGGLSGNSVFIVDNNGGRINSIGFSMYEAPLTFTSADVNGDGKDEVIAGFVKNGVNSATRLDPTGGSRSLTYNGPAPIVAIDTVKGILWRYQASMGSYTVQAGDLDGDGQPEIVAGLQDEIDVLNHDGSLRFEANVSGSVKGVILVDLNGDGNKDIVAAGSVVYAFDGSGNRLWGYAGSGPVGGIALADVEGDGSPEVIVGSDRLRILNKTGGLIWSSDKMSPITALKAGDFNGDSYLDVVTSGTDQRVRGFDTKPYMQQKRATVLLRASEDAYRNMSFAKAKDLASQANDFFKNSGDNVGLLESGRMLTRISDRMTADAKYNEAASYLNQNDYANAEKTGQAALDLYQKLGDMQLITQATHLVNYARSYPRAGIYLANAREAYAAGDYLNASEWAAMAVSAYQFIEMENTSQDALAVQNLALMGKDAQTSISRAVSAAGNESYDEAYALLDGAETSYRALGDEKGIASVEEGRATVDGIRWAYRRALITYWGIRVGVVAVVLGILGLAMLTVTSLSYKAFKGSEGESHLEHAGEEPYVMHMKEQVEQAVEHVKERKPHANANIRPKHISLSIGQSLTEGEDADEERNPQQKEDERG